MKDNTDSIALLHYVIVFSAADQQRVRLILSVSKMLGKIQK